MPSRQLENKIKIVLDTNNLVSAQINKKGASSKIFKLFEQGKILLYTSSFQLQELKRVLNYQRIRKKYRLTEKQIKTIIKVIAKHAHKVYPSKTPQLIKKDPDDNQILAIAKEGKVNFIISGDKHLLAIRKFKNIPIITAKEFLKSPLAPLC